MLDLFEKTEIKNMTLKNRFVRSATWEGLAGEDGLDFIIALQIFNTPPSMRRGIIIQT